MSQCPVCGDLYYGDGRDDWSSRRCVPHRATVAVALVPEGQMGMGV